MALYRVEWKASARKELKKLDQKIAQSIFSAVEALAENPHPPGVKKMSGSEDAYRLRVGSYRVIYNLFDKTLIVEVIKVGHRKAVYR